MMKYIPLGLAAVALLLSGWWAATAFLDTDDEGIASTRLDPLLTPDPVAAKAPRVATLEPPPEPPDSVNRPPVVAPPPPERIVPSKPVLPPQDGGGGSGMDEPELVDPEERPQEPLGDPAAGSRSSGFVGGVVRPSARATSEVKVPEGVAWIGTPLRWVQSIASSPKGRLFSGLLMEAPRHTVTVEPYRIDRFEVTNHQYWEYLQRTAQVVIESSDFRGETLAQIAHAVIREPPQNLNAELLGMQLFEANLAVLGNAFSGLLVKDRQGRPDRAATWRNLRDRGVPAGLRLEFYDRAPPGRWIGMRYIERESDHPVRHVSLEEAIEYALFKGRHIPSEIEWEFAARGPKGLDYPWGSRGRGFPDLVNGGDPLRRGVAPTTVPVSQLGRGASWVGCFNMLGNVSEWTTSWLAPYPGAVGEPEVEPFGNLVVRGGSAADTERLAVRPALRGWVRGRPVGGPRPRMRLPWTGFRTARYEEAGRSRLPTMRYRASSYGVLESGVTLPDIYEAYQGFIDNDEIRKRFPDLDTRPGVKAFVAQPFTSMALFGGGGAGRYGPSADHGLLDVQALLAASESGRPLLFGLIHNDLLLADTWRIGGEPGPGQLAVPRRLWREDCPPGTWFVGLLHRRLALIRPDLELVYYVTNRDAPPALFSVKPMAPAPDTRRPLVSLRLKGNAARVDVEMLVPLGSGSLADVVAVIRLLLPTEPRETGAVPSWKRSRAR